MDRAFFQAIDGIAFGPVRSKPSAAALTGSSRAETNNKKTRVKTVGIRVIFRNDRLWAGFAPFISNFIFIISFSFPMLQEDIFPKGLALHQSTNAVDMCQLQLYKNLCEASRFERFV